ncbi:hypothetical protein HanRHA438_Chr01g0033151 [Helianthus annuus]|uniref:Uncharacterized protein n=1 Tax=Helianthus annuus TaxID=4232 RepID=A0A9K3JWS3_HELAN|nr:hypothetical protein HanXRQr2_Chr01g0032481 [Helianthus annuus]KAJ0627684.1 hypothetical protein HanHA89_Chr01g0028521 [Helianthus annuus]KAJ0783983.1 hypothetical protein HanLR1_Chr01g0027101 [Helianthus annuus]KAJ0948929.1 hypothetical protein HanRHA438_Chr01g0033151 [Helianthus annuus]
MSQFPHTTSQVVFTPHTTHSVSAPMGDPFLWSSPHVMPVSDPYHPFHVGYSIEDTLTSLQLQQDAFRRYVQELGRAPHPPCPCQTLSTASHTSFLSSQDSDVRFLLLDQQVAHVLRFAYALEENLVHLRRLLFSRFPPPLHHQPRDIRGNRDSRSSTDRLLLVRRHRSSHDYEDPFFETTILVFDLFVIVLRQG